MQGEVIYREGNGAQDRTRTGALTLTKGALYRLSYLGYLLKNLRKRIFKEIPRECNYGAGDGTRTRDLRLGRPLLYQLSYARYTMEGAGFEPAQGGSPGDLQSPAFGRSATPPFHPAPIPSWRRDSNPRPRDYKSRALPAELRQRITCAIYYCI